MREDKLKWVSDFNCICVGTGYVVVWKKDKSQEAKCFVCDQWRHQEKSERIKTLKELEAKGWKLLTE